jgi:hypothetical protein
MMPPGFASPYHTPYLEDEAFYILEGELAFVYDGNWLKAGSATYVFGPRELITASRLSAPPRRMLLLCAPAALECFVLEMGEDLTSPANAT